MMSAIFSPQPGRPDLAGGAPAAVPLDPRSILTSIGIVVYDWDIASDAIAWGVNAAEVLGLPDMAAWSTGRDFALLLENDSVLTRQDAVLAATAPDSGSGVPYVARYRLGIGGAADLAVDDTGRWYADENGRPTRAHGIMRVDRSPSTGSRPEERSAILTHMARDVVESGRGKAPVTVLATAIHDLSGLNERIGPDATDGVIRAVLARIKRVLRRRDRLVRYGGNRIAVILRACSTDQVRVAAERLSEAVSGEPVATARGDVTPRLLIGAACAPDHGLDAGLLLRRAESCLAVARRHPATPFITYDPRTATAPALAAAESLSAIDLLNGRRITFALQPVVDAETRALVFSESLLRVESPDGRIAAAGEVMGAIEKAGLLPLVDARMLEHVAAYLADNPDQRVSLNVSPRTLDAPDWLTMLSAHLGARRGAASRLIVEITETAAVTDPDAMRRKLEAMKAIGVSVAIDDFGAGHTSFKHLRHFPIDIVKIDGAFVQNLVRSPDDRFFVQTLIDLAHHLGVATVAEWVEDEDTARLLAGWGIDLLQGDHCGRPVLASATGRVRALAV